MRNDDILAIRKSIELWRQDAWPEPSGIRPTLHVQPGDAPMTKTKTAPQRHLAALQTALEDRDKAWEGVQYLLEYLSSPKFEADPYVNVNDLKPVLTEVLKYLTPGV